MYFDLRDKNIIQRELMLHKVIYYMKIFKFMDKHMKLNSL